MCVLYMHTVLSILYILSAVCVYLYMCIFGILHYIYTDIYFILHLIIFNMYWYIFVCACLVRCCRGAVFVDLRVYPLLLMIHDRDENSSI